MYRAQEPVFCRACGDKWSPGAEACISCGEPRAVAPSARELRPEYRAQTGRVRWVVGLLAVYATATAAVLVADVQEWSLALSLLADELVSLEQLEASDALQLATRCGQFAAFVAVAIAFGVWLFEAGRNLRALGVNDSTQTEEWRVLWYFIPVLNLYMPFIGMRDLWSGCVKSSRARAGERGRTPWLIPAWWALWVVSIGLMWTWVSLRYEIEEPLLLLRSTQLSVAAITARLGATALLAVIVLQVHGRQEHAARELVESGRA